MGQTFVFVNQKGGVGKTTSVINIGAYMALEGKKTLLVDFDSQGNMTSGVGVDRKKPTVYDLLAGRSSPADVVRKTSVPRLFAIPASIDLSGATVELVEQKEREFFFGQVYILPFFNGYYVFPCGGGNEQGIKVGALHEVYAVNEFCIFLPLRPVLYARAAAGCKQFRARKSK